MSEVPIIASARCAGCGNEFSGATSFQKFCSNACRNAAWKRERRAPKRKETAIVQAQQQHNGHNGHVEPERAATRSAADVDPPVTFLRINRQSSRNTPLGMTLMEVSVIDASGQEVLRSREVSGDEMMFIHQAATDVRICGPEIARGRLPRVIWASSFCPLPLGGTCVHPPHIERRKVLTELAQFFGLL